MERPRSFVLVGRSGCGKGTQAQLLEQYLRREDPKRRVLNLSTGEQFRRLAAGKKYSSKLVREVIETGGLMPPALAIWNWTGQLLAKLRGNEHLIIDGTPRTRLEAEALDGVFRFYGRLPATILLLDVSNDWSRARLRGRGRRDDLASGIEQRLAWFDTQVVPALKFLRAMDDYEFLTINGEQTIEEVHQEIVQSL